MAALSTLAFAAGGALVSALARKKQGAAPTLPTLPAAPDPAIAAQQKQEAAQRAASYAHLRSSVNPAGVGGTNLTGPAGLPSPAPVARKGLLGQ